ncbi:restriction endonuclease subunit S [Desnuesiella massiliensis]|uniref:restriction endonuclease subunit S n=1 Tax=Desnuesiella massiliensis TaxID=1650662 RepID=UPI0006E3EBBA|nr:restriction endonuclease subunit S [Desnuesiella massiliensis]
MDGLEAVEIKLSEVLKENLEFRIDSEFFKKEYLEYDNMINKLGYHYINDFATVTDGIHESIDFDENSNINLISAKSPKQNVFDLSGNGYISNRQHEKNPRTALKYKDVIISTVGTIGNCAVVNKTILPANCDRHVGIIRVNKTYSPYYLSTFMLTKYGVYQSIRHSTGNVQLNLFIYKIKNIKIPNAGNKFQEIVEKTVIHAHELLAQSTKLYKQAEEMLLSEIGFKENELNNKNISVKTLSSSFNATGRLDAEYYQPKYDEIIEKIKNYKNGSKKIAELCELKDSNYLPLSGKEYKYIELSNIGTLGNIIDSTIDFGENLPSRARRQVKSGNIIVSSIEGSLKSCAIINENYNNAICSTGFYVLSSKLINSETLLLLFKSEPVQLILKQNCSGTILTSLNKIDFLNIELPIIDGEIQNNIKELILETNILKQNSEKLLNIAKQAVEMAIEEGELTAIKWIEEKMKDITKQ